MKKIYIGILQACLVLSFYACDYDNFDEPSARFSGRIIDSTTGENFIMTSKGLELRMWETSWEGTATPSPQTVNIKDDATFNNDKLFGGTYQVIPYNGAFWPVRDTTVVTLHNGKQTTQDFTITPYLKLRIVEHRLDGRTLTISGKIEAPVVDGLPKVIDIQPFVAITRFVGDGNISEYSDRNKVEINKNFSEGVADEIYTMTIPDMKPGVTFYVRLGARVDDSYKKHNYSEIIEIKTP
jgi:hypothetical protein